MKKLFLPFLFLLFLSCNKQPKCNDVDVQEMVIKALQKKVSDNVENLLKNNTDLNNHENYKSFQPLLKNRDLYLKDFEIKFFDFRTTETKTDIKKCNCEAEISVVDKSNKKLNEIETEWVGGDFNIANYNPTIKYSAQITDEKKIFVTIINYEDFEIYERNILAKVILDIRNKNESLDKTVINNTSTISSNRSFNEEPTAATTAAEATTDAAMPTISPGNYYYIDGSPESPVFFYNSANYNDRKNARFTTFEKVYIESISGDFGFVRFTNTRNQTSKGWIKFSDLTL